MFAVNTGKAVKRLHFSTITGNLSFDEIADIFAILFESIKLFGYNATTFSVHFVQASLDIPNFEFCRFRAFSECFLHKFGLKCKEFRKNLRLVVSILGKRCKTGYDFIYSVSVHFNSP